MATIRVAPKRQARSEVEKLKRLAAGIIRAQGNRFIKELLRDKGIRIGTNKDAFERNLTDAIEAGKLTLQDVDSWLQGVEGWGNQHVYLYQIPASLREDLTEPKIRRRVQDNSLDSLWDAKTVLKFPKEPTLTSISFDSSILRIVWQESSPGWTPTPKKNFERTEGLDTYLYRAYRKIEWRAITRFEARLDEGLAGLFISAPIEGEEHQRAVVEAKRVIGLLLDLPVLESAQVDISVVSRNLDQGNVPTNAVPQPDVKTQRSRLGSGGSYVEFAANSRDKAYWEESAIQDIRKSVRTQQLAALQGTEGVFLFPGAAGIDGRARTLRVQLYGEGDRVRLWAQMDAQEVWSILSKLSQYK